MNEATEIHYCVIDRVTGERHDSLSSASRQRAERWCHMQSPAIETLAHPLGIGRINPDGTIDDVTDIADPGITLDALRAQMLAGRH